MMRSISSHVLVIVRIIIRGRGVMIGGQAAVVVLVSVLVVVVEMPVACIRTARNRNSQGLNN